MKKILLASLLAAVQSLASAAVPSQYFAKLYSEALGRSPDTSGWQGMTNNVLGAGCSVPTLKSLANNIFTSAEYNNKAYTNPEKILTVYRAILSREPDRVGFDYFVNALNSGAQLTDVIAGIMSSAEFVNLTTDICSGNGYRQDGSGRQAIDIGSGVWTQAQLESCLANNPVCSVPPRTVVYLNSTLTIPTGKILETQGGFDHYMYARQARIVRNSPNQGILIVMQRGSVIRNVWVSGQRHLYKGNLVPQPTAQANVFPNINYVGGDYGVIRGVRSDAPLSGTHIATFPVPTPAVPTKPGDFLGSILIDNNLTTGYMNSHIADGTPIPWADGISNHISNATISNNHIIDPTDVGIVIFGHDGSTQKSTASNNLILHAGLSAYGSLGMDATQCTGQANACLFSGTGYTNNTIFAGQNTHSDIMLFNGTGAWLPPNCSSTTSGKGCGTGAQMSNNRTILNDPQQVVRAQVGINVDGMLNAVTSGNNLRVNIQPPANPKVGGKDCFINAFVVNGISSGHASGQLQLQADADIDACIGHPAN